MIIFRAQIEVCRADRLVGFLGVLRLGRITTRVFRQVAGAVVRLDHGAGSHIGFLRHVDAVGPHIGDAAFLVELLCCLHGALGVEAELAAGFLLQGRGDEGRGRVALDRLGFDADDRIAAYLDDLQRAVGVALIAEGEFLERFAIKAVQAGLEGGAIRGAQLGHDVPVFLGPEAFDLVLAVAHNAQGNRLHASGRARARQFAPENRGQVEAHQIVQRAAGQIGVDQFGIDGARMLHGLGDGRLGDGVEHDAFNGDFLLQGPAFAQRLNQVPGDGFSLAIRVGRQDQRVGVFQGIGDIGNALGRFGVGFPDHFEVVFGVNRAVFRGQIADVSVGGEDFIVLPKVLVDRFGLCRRLDDDKFHAGVHLFKGGRDGL